MREYMRVHDNGQQSEYNAEQLGELNAYADHCASTAMMMTRVAIVRLLSTRTQQLPRVRQREE